MGKLAGWILPLTLLAVALLAWRSAQPSPEVTRLARDAACGPRSGCVVERADPLRIERGPTRHRYDWDTSLGTAVVECRRALVLAGPWSCFVERERLGVPQEAPNGYPADLRRGQVE